MTAITPPPDKENLSFREELHLQRWDDHRYYHHSRINQSLHLLSATCFITCYLLLFVNPGLAALLGQRGGPFVDCATVLREPQKQETPMNKFLTLFVAVTVLAAAIPSTTIAADQKSVLVTGASSGIGRNLTEMLAENGYHVYAGARKAADLEELDAIDNVTAVELDVNGAVTPENGEISFLLGWNTLTTNSGDFGYETGRECFAELIEKRGSPPDAVIAANDVMAIGCIDEARESHGLSVPGDISIVGFDGVGPARYSAYALTTVRQPVQRMTQSAASMLLERIENPELSPEKRAFSGIPIRGRSARLNSTDD